MDTGLPPWKPPQGLMRKSGNDAYQGLQSLRGLFVDTVRARRRCTQVRNEIRCVVIRFKFVVPTEGT